MKKIILTAVVFSATLFTSCKKEYVCDCKKIYTGSSTSTTVDDGSYTFKDSRTRAETRCNEQEGTGSDFFGGDYTRECQIK